MTAIKLSKPIQHGEDQVAVLELRDPTVDDVSDIGYPFLMIPNDGDMAMELRPKVIMRYAARLSGLPPSSLKTISLSDLSKIQEAVMDFFGDVAENPPSLSTGLLK